MIKAPAKLGTMKYLFVVGLFFGIPILLSGQTRAEQEYSDQVLDSLERTISVTGSVRAKAEQIQAILGYIFGIEEVGYGRFPGQLDSLNQCCIAGKTDDLRFENRVTAESDFYNGWTKLIDEPSEAKRRFENALPKYAMLGDSFKMAWSHLALCLVASAQGDSLYFAEHYENAVRLVNNHNSLPYFLFVFYNHLGMLCYDFGRYAESAFYNFKNLDILDKYGTLGGRLSRSFTLRHIGDDYCKIGDLENGEKYIKMAIQSAMVENLAPVQHYGSLAWCLIEKKDYGEALSLLNKMEEEQLSAFSLPGKSIQLATMYYSQATCYRNLGDLNKAYTLAKKAVKCAPDSIDVSNGSMALMELAACEMAFGMEDQALQHALISFNRLVNAANTEGREKGAELISNIYKYQGNYRKALEYSELHYRFMDQIERQQSARQLAFGEFNRNAEVEKAKREAEVQAQLTRQRNIRYTLFAGLGVLTLLVFLFYNRFRLKQKTAAQLEAKNREVEVARLRAETSEAFKSRFLANMSHEIRAPLHGIAGFTDLLLETSLSEKQRRWLSSIHHSTERLSEVVNDILDLSKVEAREVKLRQIPFSPARVAADVQEALSIRVENKGIELNLHISEYLPEAVLGDPTRLYQILMNLTGNAVKFTEKGKVELSVTSDGVNSSHPVTTLRFSVSDTGIGIPPEKLSAVFESFRQASDDTTARFGGTGLGLSIARELVQLHGSNIQVESTPDEGSTFSFTLMLPLANAADLALEAQRADALHFTQPLNILVADDNPLNREIAAEALRRHFEQAEITEAANGREVLEYMKRQIYDLVLMDIQMPEMTGTEAARYIRQYISKDIPIIALTASATPEEIKHALASGMDRHLGKPFKPWELATVIAEVLRLSGKSAQAGSISESKETWIAAGDLDDEAFDLSFLRDFCNGDEAQMQHFIKKFLVQCPLEIEKLETALRAEDQEAVYHAAHSFRPQLEFVGLQAIGDLMWRLEQGARDSLAFGELTALLGQVKAALQRLPVDKK